VFLLCHCDHILQFESSYVFSKNTKDLYLSTFNLDDPRLGYLKEKETIVIRSLQFKLC